jgi:hypothetical protein
MEQLPVSERLPRLYRAVLDAVAELEACGRRNDAAAVRAEATAAYSKAWNLAAERRLTSLRARAGRIVDSHRPVLVGNSREAVGRPVELERWTA